jgi:hypothetical protein
MYIVIEKSAGRLYAYCEDAAQFKQMEKVYRHTLEKLTPQTLDDEPDLSDIPNNSYIPFKLSAGPAKKKSAKKPKKTTKKKSRAS